MSDDRVRADLSTACRDNGSVRPGGAPHSARGSPHPALPAKPEIGLLGGIGSGKSQVSAALARRGGRVVAGDPLGHEALRQPEVVAEIVRRWGPGVLDA